MLLSLLGYPTHRTEAKALFLADRHYAGASLDDIRRTLVRTGAIASAEWIYFDKLSVESIAKRIRGGDRRVATPTILSFGIVHPILKVRARHVAVLLSASSQNLELLDPLARAPAATSAANVIVMAPYHVTGSRYRVDRHATVALLRWARGS
jgi:hypothetical protein